MLLGVLQRLRFSRAVVYRGWNVLLLIIIPSKGDKVKIFIGFGGTQNYRLKNYATFLGFDCI